MTVNERNEKTGSTLISGTVWRNWARTVEVRPTLVARPTSAAGVQRAIETALAKHGIAGQLQGLLQLADMSGVAVSSRMALGLNRS